MLLEFVDSGEVGPTGEGLLICATMDGYEIGTSIFESLHEIHKEFTIFPSESSFHRYGDFHCLRHLLDDAKRGITIDHE